MIAARFWIIGVLLMPLTGCAVNDLGLVTTRYFENESSYLQLQEAWGGYLSTRTADRGLTLGHAERLMVYPKPGNQPAFKLDEFLQHPAKLGFAKEITAQDAALGDAQPYAWIEKNQGLVFHANALKSGFSLGLDFRNVLRLPAGFDGVFIFSAQRDGTIQALIHENPKPK